MYICCTKILIFGDCGGVGMSVILQLESINAIIWIKN